MSVIVCVRAVHACVRAYNAVCMCVAYVSITHVCTYMQSIHYLFVCMYGDNVSLYVRYTHNMYATYTICTLHTLYIRNMHNMYTTCTLCRLHSQCARHCHTLNAMCTPCLLHTYHVSTYTPCMLHTHHVCYIYYIDNMYPMYTLY
jgi:hypothetical protein